MLFHALCPADCAKPLQNLCKNQKDDQVTFPLLVAAMAKGPNPNLATQVSLIKKITEQTRNPK